MTATYIIHPIPLVSFRTEMPKMTHLQNYGRQTEVVIYTWLVENDERKICVDAGPKAEILEERGYPGVKTIQTLEEGLGRWKVKPEEIDMVILTHLHHDHIARAPKFTKARFYVQEDELAEAGRWNEHPLFLGAFPPEMIEAVPMETVKGDCSITDGIEVLLTRGHTVGTQSVAVNTSAGKAVIYGACSIDENFNLPADLIQRGVTEIPPAIHIDAAAAYDSQARIRALAGIIIPVHEPAYAKVPTIPE